MPVPREFVVEADGGSRGNPGPAGYGAVVLDPVSGETLAEAAEYIGVATNNVAEYKGLVAGLKAAHALDPEALVRVRMDSKLVVEQMSGRWKIKHPDMKPLAAEAARVFPPAQVTYEWIPRERNKHADRLANEAMDAGKRGTQWEPSRSTAALDARDAEAARVVGDAAAGAAKARAALVRTGGSTAAAAPVVSDAVAGAELLATPAPASAGWGAPDLGLPATFVMLRHGETVLTPEKRFSGSGGSDPALSAVGRRQADAVAAALAERGTIQAIVSSPLRRCRETADAVASRLGLPVSVEEGLRETDFAAWEGLTYAEVRERYPDDLEAWLASPKAAPTGGGESFATVARRVAATRDKLLALHQGRTVLLVTHVTPVKTLVRLALGAPPESLFRMELSAASLSAVAYYADGNASLRLLNDTSHLR
ncbi:bifunctional RNase H/acid phosphatase [Streptomyces pristinaespiralis]|uniref:Bifunctional RNase H/acid phosphatase n=1 Tax=Streptomyces pristinaespiralis TaxID=38300 RepID=A0A0M4DDP2_STRPR|nr:bifunctional RNase H/acid phosphatase [Streptomyces pristinaespiralis]ALC23515.1 bifunctional RNase H/acid phosphatase [Streptomyces pristinaespiralis]QMU14023.1 bifunctional RNase H/acid phosphatase [Streptomyces pristinaespiralis]